MRGQQSGESWAELQTHARTERPEVAILEKISFLRVCRKRGQGPLRCGIGQPLSEKPWC